MRRVQGLELIDKQELEGDEDDEHPVLYLLVPDARALRELESLWRRWKKGEELGRGYTAWRDVFSLLRDLRPWGPQDRVLDDDIDILNKEITSHSENEFVRVELELVYRDHSQSGAEQEAVVRRVIAERAGRVVSSARIGTIAYHALLVDLPVNEVRLVVARSLDGIAGVEPIMFIRSQSMTTTIELEDVAEGSAVDSAHHEPGKAILGVLDGVPVPMHSLLSKHLIVDDPFELESKTSVDSRVHGTAMASLIVHGDLNRGEQSLPRKILLVPVLGEQDKFPKERLVVDLIYQAVLKMRYDPEAVADTIVVVNVSLGDPRRSFQGLLSPWAKLLDRLAYQFGILFIVSAGNWADSFSIPGFGGSSEYEDAEPKLRAAKTIRALGDRIAYRRLLAPGETVNGLTVGACNENTVLPGQPRSARVNVDPYSELPMANPSSGLGPGFARAVKPDVLLAGGREHLHSIRSGSGLEMKPAQSGKAAGLAVAAPPQTGLENRRGYIGGTSAAAALASRTAHRIHDALEAAYGEPFLKLPPHQRAVLLKALLAHTATWPKATADVIRSVLGPSDSQQHVRQRENIFRFLGYGLVNPEDAIACTGDRAIFWAVGTLEPKKVATISIPVPLVIGGKANPHALSATLAWFTPTDSGSKSYRAVRLRVLNPEELRTFGVEPDRDQPDERQTGRGTLFRRRWIGRKAAVVGPDTSIELRVQREPDPGTPIDEAIPYGLAVTLEMPGIVELYEQVRQRLGLVTRVTL